MIPPIWAFPSLEGYLPITAPKGPLIFTHPDFPFQAETERESSARNEVKLQGGRRTRAK